MLLLYDGIGFAIAVGGAESIKGRVKRYMAAIVTDDPAGASSLEGLSSAQHQSSEVTEWRSSDQVESCTPSTSPPYWDTDSDDDGGNRYVSFIAH